MDPVTSTATTDTSVHFLNLEYWFRLLYELFFGGGHITSTGLTLFLSHLWLWVTIIGYLVAMLAIGMITFIIVRLYELRAGEVEKYGPFPHLAHGQDDPHHGRHARWSQIEELMHSKNQNDWRTAIIEADIYLGDILTREGYVGTSIGDQLKQVNRATMGTLDDAWEAHKVRNEIAHQGSSYPLSESLALRTISKYENVFRELQAL
jgi:hypothetical protein